MRIIALDIDDCVLPTNNNYFGMTNDNLIMLDVNMRRLAMILEKWNMKVFITSSWYVQLKLEEGVLGLKYGTEGECKMIVQQFDIISKHIGNDVIGLSCGNRVRDINTLSAEGHNVVALDDMDLSECNNDNALYIKVNGFINGNVGYRIKNFLEE